MLSSLENRRRLQAETVVSDRIFIVSWLEADTLTSDSRSRALVRPCVRTSKSIDVVQVVLLFTSELAAVGVQVMLLSTF